MSYHLKRRVPPTIFELMARGNATGRGYDFRPYIVDKETLTESLEIRVIATEREGTSFRVQTPAVIRGKIVEHYDDFINLELEKPIEWWEVNATLPADPLSVA